LANKRKYKHVSWNYQPQGIPARQRTS